MSSETLPQQSISGAEARRAARNAGAIAAASLLSRGLQFGWQLILVPGLGPAAYGIYGAVAAFIMIGSAIPNFGMGPIFIRDVARRPEQTGKYLSAILFMQTLLALVAYIGVNAAAAAGGYSEAVRAFLGLAGLSLMIDIIGSIANDLLLAQERMVSTSIITIAHIIALIALAGLGLASGYGLFGVYIGMILAGISRSAALWVIVLRNGTRPTWPVDRALAWTLLVNGAPLAAAAFLNLAYQQVDKLLTNRLVGNEETAYLTAAFLIIFGVVELLNTTILIAVFPLMSRSYGDGRNPLFGFMVEKLTIFNLLVSLPITLVVSIFAAEITVPLFGEDFRPTADVLRILMWYALVSMNAAILIRSLIIQNRQKISMLVRALGLGLNVVLLLILLPRMGVRGAAVSSVAAECMVALTLLTVFHAAGWNRRELLGRAARLAILGAAVAALMIGLGQIHPVLGGAAGLALYAVGVLRFGILRADDWDLIYRLTAAMPGGSLVLKYWRRDVQVNW